MKILFLFLISILSVSANETVSLQLKWFHQFQFAGYYAGKEKGFYQAQGLEVEIYQRNPNKNNILQVVNGERTYGVADSSLIDYFLKDYPVALLAAIYQHSPLVLIALRNSNIISPYEMHGKKIMFQKGVDDAAIISLFKETQLTNYHYISHSFNAVNDLLEGKVDVISAYLTNQPFLFKQKDIAINIINPQNYGIDFYGDLLFTSQQELQQYPDRAERFRKASLQGWQYALEHPDEMIEIILEKYNNQGLSKAHLEYEAQMVANMILPAFIELGLIDKRRLQSIINAYKKLNAITIDHDINDLLYQKNNTVILTQEEKQWLKLHPDITLGTNLHLEPFVFVDENGKLQGIDVELLDLINQKLGSNIKLVADDWQIMLKKAKSKIIDGLSASIFHKEREDFFIFSQPYLEAHRYVFTKKNKNFFTLKDLQEKTVAIETSTLIDEKILQQYPSIKIKYFNNLQQAAELLSKNQVDAVISSENFYYFLNKHMFLDLDIAFILNHPKLLVRYSIRNDWPLLVDILNKAIAAITEEEREAIVQKWLGSFSYHNKKLQFTAQELAWLEQHKVIRMGFDPFFVPYHFTEQGEFKGIDSAYIKYINQLLNIEIQPVFTQSWQQTLALFSQGRIDILASVANITERKKNMEFTQAYHNMSFVVVTQQNKSIMNLQELKDMSVAIIKDYASSILFQQDFPNIDFYLVTNTYQALKAVSEGRVEATIIDLATFSFLVKKHNFYNLKVAATTNYNLDLSFAIRKDWPILVEILNKALNTIPTELQEKYYNQWLTVEFDYKWKKEIIIVVFTIILFIILWFLYWNNKLKQKIAQAIQEKAAQEQLLIQQSRFAAMGEMIGAIAHQWRQPLTALSGVLINIQDYFEYEALNKEKLAELVSQGESTIDYMSQTIDDFRNFFKPTKQKQIFDILKTTEQALLLLSAQLKNNNIKYTLAKNPKKPYTTFGYPNEFQQVIINIIQNAKDAIIESKNQNFGKIIIDIYKEKNLIFLKIKDNGDGIAPAIQDKIFDPYFTTKEQGKGTGIGLYMAKVIIEKNMQGEIKMENINGGCQFTITLPLIAM